MSLCELTMRITSYSSYLHVYNTLTAAVALLLSPPSLGPEHLCERQNHDHYFPVTSTIFCLLRFNPLPYSDLKKCNVPTLPRVGEYFQLPTNTKFTKFSAALCLSRGRSEIGENSYNWLAACFPRFWDQKHFEVVGRKTAFGWPRENA